MQDRREEGRALLAASRRTIQEFSMGALGPLVELSSAWRLETLLDDHHAAERTTRAVAERAREVADNWYYVLASVDLARVLCERGDPQQCLRVLDESERHPSPPDIEILVKRPAARALALARIGQLEDAQLLARDAVAHARGTRFVCVEADALLVLAEVLRLEGRSAEAVAALEEALALYERKGNVVSATKARVMLAELT
jgi:tetratricopeptide (TPR) repeat protein